MAFDAFLKIAGIEGEVLNSKHKGEIEVLSFSWGAVQPTSTGGNGGATGRVQVQDFSFVKKMDKATPILFQTTCTGEHIPDATLTLANKATSQEFLKIKFSDVLISSFQTGGSSTGGTDAVEQINLKFSDLLMSSADANGNWTDFGNCGGFNALVQGDNAGDEPK